MSDGSTLIDLYCPRCRRTVQTYQDGHAVNFTGTVVTKSLYCRECHKRLRDLSTFHAGSGRPYQPPIVQE